MLTFFR